MTALVETEQPQGTFILGLFGFQSEAVVAGYEQWLTQAVPALDVQYAMGTGKTALSIALACYLFDDDEIDQVIVVAEQNKIRDWSQVDFPKFSTLDVGLYAGTPGHRAKVLTQGHQGLVMTYETGRNDIALFKKGSKRAIAGPGPLAEYLKGKRTLIIMDEVTKVRNRSSRLHVAWNYAINRYLRKGGDKVMAIGLTGTKIEASPADHYNVNRLLAPHLAPSVEDFESTYVAGWDRFGNINAWKNLDPATSHRDVTPLSEVFSDITVRKSKSDPDVMAQFPSKVENPPTFVTLSRAHRDFYADIEAILHAQAQESDDDGVAGLVTLRQIATAPAALVASQGEFGRSVVREVGDAGLRSLGSAKIDAVANWAREAGDQQMVIFTFFGQSVLPLIHDRLRDEGLSVVVNHGQMSGKDRQEAQDVYKGGDAQVFLSSDAGARGLNLGVGSALLHVELPLLSSTYEQRSDRIHRVDSVHPSVTVDSLISAGTIEEGVMDLVLKRNEWSERVSDGGLVEDMDPGIMTASVRKALWSLSKASVRRR